MSLNFRERFNSRRSSRVRSSRMSIKLDNKGYENMIGTEYEGSGMTPGFVFFNMVRGNLTKVKPVVKGEAEDEIFDGVFYDKDCYMFLLTEEKGDSDGDDDFLKHPGGRGGSPFRWKIYVWKGSKASLIQFGFAGTKANDLQKKLVENGNYHDCAISKIRQGQETQEFKDLFAKAIVVKKGNRIRTGIHSEGDAPVTKIPKLYMVKQDRLSRIPIRADCLLPDRNYILDIGNAVFSYSGDKCGRIERAYTEEMARRRCKADYRKKIKASRVEAGDKKVLKKFHSALKSFEQSKWSEWNQHFDPMLFEVNRETSELEIISNDADQSVKDKASQAKNGEIKSNLFDAEMLKPSKMFVLDCMSEIFFWIGKGIPAAEQQRIRKVVDDMKNLPGRPDFISVEVLRQNMETVFFKERFFGFDQTDLLEVGGQVRNIKTEQEFMVFAKDDEKKVRLVSKEWKRILQFMQERESDFMNFQDLHVAHDKKGRMIAFKYDQKGDMSQIDPWEFGLFKTTNMYTYIYSCKNDTIHYIFTWEGEHASLRAKTVAGISTTGKDIPGLTEELLGTKMFKFVSQGKESRLLTYLMEAKGKNLLIKQCVPTAKKRNQGAVQDVYRDTKLRKIYAFEVNENGQFGARTSEIAYRNIVEHGLYDKFCYLIFRGPKEEQKFARLNSVVDFTPTEVFYYVGSRATENCKELVQKIAKDPLLPKAFGYQDFTALSTFNRDLNDEKVKNEYWKKSELNLSISTEELLPPSTRPARLFLISHTLRKQGGMFILDVGDGCFAQSDLKENEVYILDTGSTKIYLWIGPKCTKAQIRLGLESAAQFKVLHIKNIKLPADKYPNKTDPNDVEIVIIDHGEETLPFTSCFYGWKNFTKSRRGFAKKYQKDVPDFLKLAEVPDAERIRQDEEKKAKFRTMKFESFKREKSLRMSRMKTLKRGRLVSYRTSVVELSVWDKVGDRLELDEDTKTLTATQVDKPLRFLQKEYTLDQLFRSVQNSTDDWVLFRYSNFSDIDFVTKGKGTAETLMSSINDNLSLTEDGEDTGNNVFYAVLNIKAADLVTNLTKADRALFVVYIPETTKPILRAAVNVHRTFVAEVFGPCFSEVTVRAVEELNQDKAVAIASSRSMAT